MYACCSGAAELLLSKILTGLRASLLHARFPGGLTPPMDAYLSLVPRLLPYRIVGMRLMPPHLIVGGACIAHA